MVIKYFIQNVQVFPQVIKIAYYPVINHLSAAVIKIIYQEILVVYLAVPVIE